MTDAGTRSGARSGLGPIKLRTTSLVPWQASATPSGFGGLRFGEAAAYFILAVVLDVIVGVRARPDILQGFLSDPDTLMRLVRLRDILAQHAPLHVVARDSSGDGTVLHWSHLLDSLLLILGAPLRLWLNWDRALHAAAIALGPISAGLLGVATAWATAPLAERGWRWTAPVWAALASPIIGYGLPGVADHHVLLAVGAVMMPGAAGRLAVGNVAAGLTLGTWTAASIWLSPEAMPFAVLAFGGAGLAWTLRPGLHSLGIGIASAGTAFLLLTGAALAVDPPAGGYWSAAIDGIFWRGMLGSGVALAGMLLWVALFPVMLRGSGALGDTPEARAMYSRIQEVLPVTSFANIVAYLLNATLAAVLLVCLALRDRKIGWRAALWTYGALSVVGLVVLGQLHVRFTTHPSAAAAMMVPVALTELTRLLSSRSQRVQATARIALVAMMFLDMRADALAGLCGLDNQEPPQSANACDLQGIGPTLAPWAGEVVLTDVNDVPGLLYRTGIRTVGSLYPGSVAGYTRLVAAWGSGPSRTEPDKVRATRATLVLFCKHQGRSSLVDGLPGNTLWDRLGCGEVPTWLNLVASNAQSEAVLYRIVDSESD
jgi:hypothetical protein